MTSVSASLVWQAWQRMAYDPQVAKDARLPAHAEIGVFSGYIMPFTPLVDREYPSHHRKIAFLAPQRYALNHLDLRLANLGDRPQHLARDHARQAHRRCPGVPRHRAVADLPDGGGPGGTGARRPPPPAAPDGG